MIDSTVAQERIRELISEIRAISGDLEPMVEELLEKGREDPLTPRERGRMRQRVAAHLADRVKRVGPGSAAAQILREAARCLSVQGRRVASDPRNDDHSSESEALMDLTAVVDEDAAPAQPNARLTNARLEPLGSAG